MAATGFTPIQLYHSTTASAAPSAGNLAAGELAVNITDGKLFYKDNGGVVQVLATKAGASGDVVGPGSSTDNALVRFDGTTGKLVQSSVGILDDSGNLTGIAALTTSGALTLNGGTANGVAYLNGSKVLTTGSALTFDGTNLGLNATPTAYGANYRTFALNGVSGTQIDFQVSGTVKNYIYGSAATFQYDSTSNHAWSLSGSEQMRLTSTGLGIGTSSPTSFGAGYTTLTISGSNSGIFQSKNTLGDTRLYANTSGEALVGSWANTALKLYTNSTLQATLDSSGNLGLGFTPSALLWPNGSAGGLQLQSGALLSAYNATTYLSNNWYYNAGEKYIGNGFATRYEQTQGKHVWYYAGNNTSGAGATVSWTQAMTLDASGRLLIGTTSAIGSNTSVVVKGTSAGEQQFTAWNATTSGDPYFAEFGTEASYTSRGSIRYNRSTGLVNYNTTSDYRAKDIIGPVIDSGAVIDSTPVYMGKMKGATQERPMFIAHETPPYAHTGEKDAVDADGNPVYQQMDASALVPVLWAEVQSLRKRITELEQLKADVAALKGA